MSRALLVMVVAGVALVVAALVGGPLAPRPVAAQASAAGSAGQTLTVSRTTGLDPAGEAITVSGSGYDESKGIYVSFCVLPPPGQKPTPCAGGIDLTGSGGSTVWVTSDAPAYAQGLTTPFGPGGTFEVGITVAAALADGFDCQVIACAVSTRADHTRGEDRTADVFVPVSFAPGASTAPSSTPPASPPASMGSGSCGPVTASVVDVIRPLDPLPVPVLPVTVTDAAGNTVTVTDVERILPVNLYGSIAEIVFSLGLGDGVIGRDTSTTFPDAAALPLVTVNGHDLSAEAILELDPSIVLADPSIGPGEVFDQLRAAGVTVVMLDELQTIEDVPGHIRSIAAALGVPEAGERLVARTAQEIDAATAAVVPSADPPSIAFLYLRGPAGIYLITGDGAGPDAMIEAIGARDAGAELGVSGFKPITSEALINAAPDVILVLTDSLDSVGGVDGLLSVPGVAQTPAGEERRIVDMDDGVLLNFGTRTGAAIEALAKAVYQPCG
ncbi:MAG: ABC transporter substrate-binding protein [Candidatus Limnocylindrales bacterium]